MTLTLAFLSAAAGIALLLLLIRHARNSQRRETTWICTLCRAGFSDPVDAELHLIVAHHRKAS